MGKTSFAETRLINASLFLGYWSTTGSVPGAVTLTLNGNLGPARRCLFGRLQNTVAKQCI